MKNSLLLIIFLISQTCLAQGTQPLSVQNMHTEPFYLLTDCPNPIVIPASSRAEAEKIELSYLNTHFENFKIIDSKLGKCNGIMLEIVNIYLQNGKRPIYFNVQQAYLK